MLNPYLTPPRREQPLVLRVIAIAVALVWLWWFYGMVMGTRAGDPTLIARGQGDLLAELKLLRGAWAILLTLYVVAASSAMGYTLLSRRFQGTLSPVLVFPVHLALGLGFLCVIFLLLGLLTGGYTKWLLAIVLILPGMNIMRWWNWHRHSAKSIFSDPPEKPVWWLAVLSLTAVAVLAALAPATAHDDLVYHLENPKNMLQMGRAMAEPWNAYSHLPNLLHCIYVPMMAFDPLAAAPRLLTVMLGLVTAFTLYRIGCYWFMPRAGGMAGLLFLTSPVVLDGWSTAGMDMAGAFFITTAMLVLIVAPVNRAYPHARLAGVLAGCALACRITSISAIIGLLMLVIGIWIRHLMRTRDTIGFSQVNPIGLIYAFCWPMALVLAPFCLHMWMEWKNPIYPFVWGGEGMEEIIRVNASAWHHQMGMGHSVADFVKLPWRLVARSAQGDYGHFDGVLQPWLLILVPLVIGAPRHLLRICVLVMMTAATMIVWFQTSQQVRFLMPMIPWMALIAGLGFEVFVRGFGMKYRAVVSSLFGLVIIVTGSLVSPPRDLIMFSENLQVVATHRVEREDYLLRHSEPHEALRYLDNQGMGTVLMLWENRVFHLDRGVVADPILEVPHTFLVDFEGKSAAQIASELFSSGVSNVLVRTDARDFTLGGGTWTALEPSVHDAIWDPLVSEYLELIHTVRAPSGATYEIYRMREVVPFTPDEQ